MVAGIDLSYYNGSVDFAKLSAGGLAFAFVKASEGRLRKTHATLGTTQG